jgi:hypothetical protein
MESIKFISPSSALYWEKCPLIAVFSKEYKTQQFFPKHPDTDLGSLIHSFLENKGEWNIDSGDAFEEKWSVEIEKIDYAYKRSQLQKIYSPIKWSAKYYAVKKLLLKNNLLNRNTSKPKGTSSITIENEEWIDDGKDIGGKPDRIVLNSEKKIIEIIDYKTGNIFEFVNKKKVIKESYIRQILLYAYIIKNKQGFFPKCFIVDIQGTKHEIAVDEIMLAESYDSAIKIKNRINDAIQKSDTKSLANPDLKNCMYCNYRPVCISYKMKFINNFDNKRVDIYGEVLSIKGVHNIEIKIKIKEKEIILKGISSRGDMCVGDNVFIYNLFCPDGDTQVLYAMKETIIKND